MDKFPVHYKAGILLNYSDENHSFIFEWRKDSNQPYSDVIDEFDIKLNKEEIAFISINDNQIDFIAKVIKSSAVATRKVRINIKEINELREPITFIELKKNMDLNLFSELENLYQNSTSRLSANLWNGIVLYLLSNRQEIHKIIGSLLKQITKKKLSAETLEIQNLIHERDAIGLALKLSDYSDSASITANWDIEVDDTPSFLKLQNPNYKLTEDQMIINDFRVFGDWNLIKEYKNNTATFSDGKKKVSIMNANRTSIERVLGVDLVYYNHSFKNYLFIQYKRLKKETSSLVYRPDNDSSYKTEFLRMEKFESLIVNEKIKEYRFNDDIFYFKLCKDTQEIVTRSLCKGMYIPKKYWEYLYTSDVTNGVKKGKVFSYETINKYLNNTAFIELVKTGLIGSQIESVSIISNIISETLQNGRSLILAVTESISSE